MAMRKNDMNIARKNVAAPAAVSLASGRLPDRVSRHVPGHALRLSLPGCCENGHCARDLGGKIGTDEFTRVVIDDIPAYLAGYQTLQF
jgi:hypothetical protein